MATIHTEVDRRADAAMAQYLSGDAAGFDALCRIMTPRLRPFFAKRSRFDDADDLVQETWLRAYSARERFIRGAHVVPWLFTIARRLLIDGNRRRVLHERALDAERTESAGHACVDRPDRIAESHELADRLAIALARLPSTHRAAFALVRGEGLSTTDAAHRLGTTHAAVKLRTFRVVAALRVELEAA